MPRAPHKGDIIRLYNDLGIDSDLAERPFALVVSNEGYYKYTHCVIVCPISGGADEYPMHVPLDGTTRTMGSVLCEQMMTLDLRVRSADVLEKLPADLLEAVMERIMLSLE